MEERLHESGRTPDQAAMEELESLWQRAKKPGKGRRAGGTERVTSDKIELRRCHSIDEFHACVALQKEVWNFSDAELVPLRMFVVADKVGGQVMGAFEGEDDGRIRAFGARARDRAMFTCTRTCWRCGRNIAMAGWDGA